ncbi:MAG: low molecular weight phosphotyrosine protein phosphatase [Phycisphaerales bacterium]|nr:low molecular weight phosphotyrosine protein phosphatase [Phycisphaerales bacterium]
MTRIGVLFVCMGNICRSPIAEGVFLHKCAARGVADRFTVDSAGTGGWHAGERPDPRSVEVARRHGIVLPGRARPVTHADYRTFDHLICMDHANRTALLRDGAPDDRIRLLLAFDPDPELDEVPDPYYGGDDGFDLVFRLVDRACDGLLESLLDTTP